MRPVILITLLFALQPAFAEPLIPPNTFQTWEQRGKAAWNLENGILTGGQDGDPSRSGLLLSNNDYRDFELQFDYLIDEHGKYNSGVYIRHRQDLKQPRLQINLGRGVAGEPVGLYLDDWLDPGDETDEIRRPREWNTVRIRAQGPRIQVWLNGTQIVDFADAERLSEHLEPGKIGFQTYGAEGHAGWVRFRNLTIQKLPES